MSLPPTPSILLTTPTKDTTIGRFQTALAGSAGNADGQDIFQILDLSGQVVLHMNSNGTLDPSPFPIVASVAISAAQILSMSAGAKSIEIVSPTSSLQFIYPQSFAIAYIAGTIPYTVVGSDAFYMGWGGLGTLTSSNAVGIFPDTNFIDQATSQIFVSSCYLNTSSGGVPSSQTRGKNFVLQCPDTLSAGNGTLLINISYALIPIPTI